MGLAGTPTRLQRYVLRAAAFSFVLLVLDTNAESLSFRGSVSASQLEGRQDASGGRSVSLPLIQRDSRGSLREEDYGVWARMRGQSLNTKYGGLQPKSLSSLDARASGTAYLLNQNTDSTFYTAIGIGTPPVVMNVIMDTGSSDLWVAGLQCGDSCPSGTPFFDGSRSSTFQGGSSSFAVRYESANVTGTLAKDVVQMAGYAVEDQTFAIINGITPGLLSPPVSGLMGLAFQGIATSGATPFWSRAAGSGLWDKPVMSFCLTRFLGVQGAASLEPGGIFTMGELNQSLYTGEIDYVPLPEQGTYWQIPITSLIVGNVSISLPPNSGSYAAVDTGTTLIGGPPDVIDQIAAEIPGSTPGTGDYQNYFFYPCDSAVAVSISFGGKTWVISPRDFQLLRLSSGECVSAFFRLSVGGSAPNFIIGDTFLKLVYSVFQYDPPMVGFANLSAVALSLSNIGQALPSPSIGASIIIQGSAASFRNPTLTTLLSLLLSISFALIT